MQQCRAGTRAIYVGTTGHHWAAQISIIVQSIVDELGLPNGRVELRLRGIESRDIVGDATRDGVRVGA
jgi:hypothetical protein